MMTRYAKPDREKPIRYVTIIVIYFSCTAVYHVESAVAARALI